MAFYKLMYKGRKVAVKVTGYDDILIQASDKFSVSVESLVLKIEDETEIDGASFDMVCPGDLLIVESTDSHPANDTPAVNDEATTSALTGPLRKKRSLDDCWDWHEQKRQCVEKQARLFSESGKRSKYNKEVNDECVVLAMDDQELLSDKTKLIRLASAKVNMSFPFAKGYSQSRSTASAAQGRPRVKENRLSATARQSKKKDLEIQIKGINDDIFILNRKVDTKIQCDKLEEAECIRSRIRELQGECTVAKMALKSLEKKAQKAECDKRYHQSKKSSIPKYCRGSSSGSACTSFSTSNSSVGSAADVRLNDTILIYSDTPDDDFGSGEDDKDSVQLGPTLSFSRHHSEVSGDIETAIAVGDPMASSSVCSGADDDIESVEDDKDSFQLVQTLSFSVHDSEVSGDIETTIVVGDPMASSSVCSRADDVEGNPAVVVHPNTTVVDVDLHEDNTELDGDTGDGEVTEVSTEAYLKCKQKGLNIKSTGQRISDNVQISPLDGISMSEYIRVRTFLCKNGCSEKSCDCKQAIAMSEYILQEQPVPLSNVWQTCCGGKYKAYSAARIIGKVPVVLLTLGMAPGQQRTYVIEKQVGIDYSSVLEVAEKVGHLDSDSDADQKTLVPKEKLSQLLKMVSSERDRKLLTHVASYGLGSKAARAKFGIGNKGKLTDSVEAATDENSEILVDARRCAAGDDRLNTTISSNVSTRKVNDTVKRLAVKARTRQRLLQKRIGKRTSIQQRHPNIGKVMERIVSEAGVGADKWRSSGSLTWERKKVGQKITYKRLADQVSEEIGEKVSYGTVVQLGVPKNTRHRSSCRYKSAAAIVSKKARKGFDIKTNVDEHWSNSMYKSLNKLQQNDHENMFYLNRDDAAGFRLGTMATVSKLPTLMVRGDEDVTTRTDFTNKEQSLLQVSSYCFTAAANNSEEQYVGVIKIPKTEAKNASQHVADLRMLMKMPEFKERFYRSDGKPKEVDCIRVDGGGDENPAHSETQFCWTEWHMEMNKKATFVTTRYSGGSFLNEVERLNGQLTRAASNLFIPSTLLGSNKSDDGQIDDDKVRANLNEARKVYLERVNRTPYKSSSIKLFMGSNDETAIEMQERRPLLLKYLKCTNDRQRAKLKDSLNPEEKVKVEYFDTVLQVTQNHKIQPSTKYVFELVCCFKMGCPHPTCASQSGCPVEIRWYSKGPPIEFFPWPQKDPDVDEGKCETCEPACSGHFQSYEKLLERFTKGDHLSTPETTLPSAVIDQVYRAEKQIPDEGTIYKIAKDLCLPRNLVKYPFEHLNQVAKARSRGAKKAAETRKQKKQ